MKYTIDELVKMPLSQLRNVDIHSAEEQAIIQVLVSAKIKTAPIQQPIFRGDIPEIKSKEDELKYQSVIDEREAKLKGLQEDELKKDPVLQVEENPANKILDIPKKSNKKK